MNFNKFIFEILIFIVLLFFSFFDLGFMSFLLFSFYIIYIYINYKEFIIKYVYIIFLVISNILGVFVIEYSDNFSIYLYEINQYSYKYNTLAPLIIVMYSFLIFLFNFDYFFGKYVIEKSKFKYFKLNNIKLIKIILIIIIIILFFRVINIPFFIYGIDRFYYNENILTSIEKKIIEFFIWSSPLLLISYKNTKKLTLISFTFLFIYLFWIGNKFSIFFLIFQLILIVSVNNEKFKNNISKLLKSVLIVFTLLFVITILHSSIVNNRNIEDNVKYVENRLSQQGQLWWSIYKEENSKKTNIKEFLLETDNFFAISDNKNLIHSTGMFKAMFLSAPDSIVLKKIAQGSRYAASTPAIFYYYFNLPILFFIYFLYAVTISFLVNFIIKSYNNLDVVSLIIYSKFLITIIRSFSNTDLHTVFSIENLFLIFILFIYKYIFNKVRR